MTKYIIDFSDCIEDSAQNLVYSESEYNNIPDSELMPIIYEAVNELIEEFSTNPEKHISDRLRGELEKLAAQHSEE